MASAQNVIRIRGSEDLRSRDEVGTIYLLLSPDPQDEPNGNAVTIVLPDGDEDAILSIELLGAALDNAASLVEARRSRRFRDSLDGKKLEETGPEIGRGFPAERER